MGCQWVSEIVPWSLSVSAEDYSVSTSFQEHPAHILPHHRGITAPCLGRRPWISLLKLPTFFLSKGLT